MTLATCFQDITSTVRNCGATLLALCSRGVEGHLVDDQFLKLAAAQAGLISWLTSQVRSFKVDAIPVTRKLGL